MRKFIALLLAVAVTSACSKEATPEPVPSVRPSITTMPPEPTDEATAPENNPEPVETATETKTVKPNTPTSTGSTDTEPPATQFLKRWGKQYPNVEEATIMRAGADTCKLINNADADWQTSNDFAALVQDAMSNFGQVSLPTAASFAVDANQNLCPTLP